MQLGVHYSSVSRRKNTLSRAKKLSKQVPHELTEQNLISRLKVCTSLFSRNRNTSFLNKGEEKWSLYDDRRLTSQWLDADVPLKYMPKPTLHPKKIMVTLWWCYPPFVFEKL